MQGQDVAGIIKFDENPLVAGFLVVFWTFFYVLNTATP